MLKEIIMLTAVVIDDEILALERLKLLLDNANVCVLASFYHAQKALEWFEEHQADVVFVDIGLPDINGLEFVERLSHITSPVPKIIFTTAYEEHALKAFELSAIDYLLKPIKRTRLEEALQRIPHNQIDKQENMQEFQYFNIVDRNRITKVPWQKAVCILADQKSVKLYTSENDCFDLPKTLIYWEKILGDKVIRVHRNALVLKHKLHSVFRLDDDCDSNNMRWGAKLLDIDMVLLVSRRQLATIRKELSDENLEIK